MPPQLKALIPAFTIFIVLFLIVRRLLIPDSFGDLGHYRADALVDFANKEIVHASKEACIECHSDIGELLQSDMHAGLSCLICHGPGLEHVNSPESDNILKMSGRDNCGRCHAINQSRPISAITQINLAEHNIERDDCIECHNPHQVWELKE